MLKVTIEIFPGGARQFRRTIASMSIGNITDLANVSDYRVDALESANHLTGAKARSATCIVTRHDRRQSVWALIARATEEIQLAEFDEF